MFLNDHPPIAGGREIWGFPKKLAQPSLAVETDTLVGPLDYGSVRIATGTMGYKHRALDTADEPRGLRSEEHMSELQAEMRISYPVLWLTTKTAIYIDKN